MGRKKEQKWLMPMLKSISGEHKMCSSCSKCFTELEKKKLKRLGWKKKEIDYAEGSIVEYRIKKMLK